MTRSTVLIPWHGGITWGAALPRAAALHVTLDAMARLDVTLEPTGAPELPEEARLPMRKLIDEVAGYLEQTWDLMVRPGRRLPPQGRLTFCSHVDRSLPATGLAQGDPKP